MTKLLEQAVERARLLPDVEQDAIAQILLDEIESERKWDELLSRRGQKLEELADQALRDHENGLTEPLDPDKL